jgi:hypothetical protein
VALAIAISLAVHAVLLSVYRQPQGPALPAAATEPLTVRLRAAPASPAENPPAPEPAHPAAKPEAQPKPAPRPRPPRRIIAVPPAAAPSDQKPFTVDTPPAAPTAAPRFDLDAARKAARTVANEPDPAKVGTALERLPPKPYETETRLEKGIKGAKRANCKDGVPGGLLAPIFLAMDKKDSGCKW